MSTRRYLFIVLGIVAGLLLGVTKIGVTEIAPGLDTGFHESPACDAAADLCLETRVGDIEALVVVDVEATQPGIAGPWEAALIDGTPLRVEVRPAQPAVRRLRISAAVDTTAGPGRLAKFTWPSGIALGLRNDSTRGPVALADWAVYSSDEEPDSATRATRRTALFWASVVFLIVAIIGAIVKAAPEPPAPPAMVSAPDIVGRIIARVEAQDPSDTDRTRAVLRGVVLGTAPVGQALDAVLTPEERASSSKRLQLLIRVRRAYFGPIDDLIQQLSYYRDRIDKPDA